MHLKFTCEYWVKTLNNSDLPCINTQDFPLTGTTFPGEFLKLSQKFQ